MNNPTARKALLTWTSGVENTVEVAKEGVGMDTNTTIDTAGLVRMTLVVVVGIGTGMTAVLGDSLEKVEETITEEADLEAEVGVGRGTVTGRMIGGVE